MDKKLRITVIKSMDTESIKNFVNHNFMEGKQFTYYKWAGYNFLSNNIHLLMKIITMEGRFWNWSTFNFTYRKFMGKLKKIYLYGNSQKKFILFLKYKDEIISLLKEIFNKIYD